MEDALPAGPFGPLSDHERGGLRARLRRSLFGFASASLALALLSFVFAERWVEQAALKHLLEQQFDYLVSINDLPAPVATQKEPLQYFRPRLRDDMPPGVRLVLKPLSLGYHEENVVLPDGTYTVLVKQVAPGDRAYLLYSEGFIRDRERRLWLVLLVLAAGLSAAAWFVSDQLGRRALVPLSRLRQALREMAPGRPLRWEAEDPELAELAAALNGYQARIEDLLLHERAFAAAASHELRTPLAVIRGAAEVIASKAPPAPMGRLNRGIHDASQQLDALLALSEGRAPPTAQEIRFPEWLVPLAEGAKAAVPNEVPIVLDGPPQFLHAPPGVVAVLVLNMLRNALRASATRTDGQGRVTARWDDTGLWVEDNGPGFEEGLLHTATEPGVRGSDGGSGLGLYISRRLGARLGWRLSVANRAEGGARVGIDWSAVQRAITTEAGTVDAVSTLSTPEESARPGPLEPIIAT